MSDAKYETARRLKIINDVSKQISQIAEGVLVGGSMGWGQNTAVKETSDIDMPIIISKNNLPTLASTDFFKGKIPRYVIEAFNEGKIDVFWVRSEVDGVEVNNFLFNPDSYRGFCTLKKTLNVFTSAFKPDGYLNGYGFDGILRNFPVEVQKFKDGYIYPRPPLYQNQYYGGPVTIDHLYSSQIINEKASFLTDIRKEFWKSIIKQLKKEYGPNVDLEKTNILNTHYVLGKTPGRLPTGIVNKIKERTIAELQNSSDIQRTI